MHRWLLRSNLERRLRLLIRNNRWYFYGSLAPCCACLQGLDIAGSTTDRGGGISEVPEHLHRKKNWRRSVIRIPCIIAKPRELKITDKKLTLSVNPLGNWDQVLWYYTSLRVSFDTQQWSPAQIKPPDREVLYLALFGLSPRDHKEWKPCIYRELPQVIFVGDAPASNLGPRWKHMNNLLTLRFQHKSLDT